LYARSLLLALAIIPNLSLAQSQPTEGANSAILAKTRSSPQRPTALPEDKPLADQFVWAAAGHVTQIRILEASKQVVPQKLRETGNWLWFNAIDLSDKAYAKGVFAKSLKEFNDASQEADRAFASGESFENNKPLQLFLKKINTALENGENLYAKYANVVNVVITNPDGSFTITPRHAPLP
jgi:hypothetical protein